MTPLAPEQYKDTLLFLTTAGLVVPLFRRLRMSPVIGFLSAGAALGPYGLGRVAHHSAVLSFFALDQVHNIEAIAEFGVVFLLFMIGLELSFERLSRLRKLVFGLGALQLGLSGVVLAGIALWLGQPPAAAIVLGAGLALSSTAVIIPVMAERRRLGTAAGRTVFSVLLFQDLMVAPLIFLVTMLTIRTGDSLGVTLAYTLLPAIAGLLLLVGGGRLLLRPLFHHVAAAGSTEFFMAACLLVVIGTGVITAISGMSMSLGAFIAGLLLAETEYRREIEVTIEPFKGLLLGLFFVAIGAGLDFSEIAHHPALTVGLAAGFIAIKIVVTFLSARAMKLSWRVATESAFMLAPGGEFAFVLVGAAIDGRIIGHAVGANVEIAVTLSLFAVPSLGWAARRLTRRLPSGDRHLTAVPKVEEGGATPRALIIGYGRVGQLIAEMLRKHEITFLALDESIATVREHRRKGVPITYGNASRIELLERCGLMGVDTVIITLDRADVAEEIVRLVRARRADVTIVARARDAEHAARLYELGVTDAVPETIEASLQLTEAVLSDMGMPMGLVIASIHEKRDDFRKLLQPVAGAAEERRAIKMSLRVKDMNKRVEAARKKEKDRAAPGPTPKLEPEGASLEDPPKPPADVELR
ncbi:Sodium/hydrogen exchanger [Beijerinckiaceae bacterium RH AL1]|nr:cation:proton antiporter [Beijerinckiaceae bacterium]VVB46942.1 Sodium/hydrogen exchanger [Beijerinckiaceae bacterium RH CH11]VVB47025.1 Sodium/hydrogen exchanger [Beijerinckiaceae bacterium RH AL8]VVC55636.1 Sodium/hydrogen exchanger [Beijerinckiaceae bacterium RH AL1]